jgi:hypothetical protein
MQFLPHKKKNIKTFSINIIKIIFFYKNSKCVITGNYTVYEKYAIIYFSNFLKNFLYK